MKEYFKRLKQHPGLVPATIYSFFGFVAGAMRPDAPWYKDGPIGLLAMGIVCWGCVLITNIKR